VKNELARELQRASLRSMRDATAFFGRAAGPS